MAIRADRVGVREDQVDIHGRVTSPSFLNELLEDLPEWTDMPVWVNGTEEVLPSNNSVPVTSPILADIAYPDIRRDNQYFTYRESPTPVDGLAKIKSIKGSILVWNQLVQNGNFASTDGWNSNGTLTVQNNVATIVFETPTRNSSLYTGARFNLITGHKYLYSLEININDNNLCQLEMHTQSWDKNNVISFNVISGNNSIKMISTCENGDSALALSLYFFTDSVPTETKTIQIKNIQIFDLTKMGLDITDPSDFTSLFSLPYYDFNQGSLLSFNGNGIKTVGKNLLMPSTVTWSDISYVDGYYDINVTTNAVTERRLFGNWGIQNAVSLGLISGTYIWTTERLGINTPTVSVRVSVHGTENYVGWSPNTSRYINADDKFFILLYFDSAGTYNGKVGIQFELGSTVTSYEPYTESVINLPISTYFPTGMKSAGNVYDELTPRKAITRIGAVDLGTLDWTLSSPTSHIFRGKLTDTNAKIPNASNLPNALLANYQPKAYNPISANDNGHFALGHRVSDEVNVLVIIDSNYSTQESFIAHISGQYLFYELATPVELPTMSFE